MGSVHKKVYPIHLLDVDRLYTPEGQSSALIPNQKGFGISLSREDEGHYDLPQDQSTTKFEKEYAAEILTLQEKFGKDKVKISFGILAYFA